MILSRGEDLRNAAVAERVQGDLDALEELLARLHREGYDPERMAHYEGPMLVTPDFRVAYVRDPDGNQLELYDIPKERNAPFNAREY